MDFALHVDSRESESESDYVSSRLVELEHDKIVKLSRTIAFGNQD
jgi:hypothetical protein